MSLPKLVARGKPYQIGHRTSERRHFFRPSAKINQIMKFCLAHAAERTGVELHSYGFLSNHYHATVTDVNGRLPEFMHWFHEFVAKCVNAELGRCESIWSSAPYSAVLLADDNATLNGLEYVFNNPVSSGLVARMSEWPGAYSTPADMERPAEIIERPKGFFRENGPVPKSATLKLSVPASMSMTVAEIETFVARREEELRQEARAEGRGFLGRVRVLKQSPFGRPRTEEERRTLNPRVAAKDKRRRIEALRGLKAFICAYREALARYLGGDRDVLFPYGTYLMRLRFGVACHGP